MSAARLIWVLQGSRTGDNAQARELASRLSGEVVLKPLDFNARRHLPNWLAGASLASLTPEVLHLISPPWPALVIATGKRTVPVARWIGLASDGAAKLIHLGRPRAALEHFDLVVSTPQYGLPAHPRLIEMTLPFAVARPVANAEIERWSAEWRDLPRPLIAVVVGASKFPLTLSDEALAELGNGASGLAARTGGSLLVLFSPRSEADTAGKIAPNLTGPHRLYPWLPGGSNPYQAALALADRFIVTNDSASMLSEALSTGKPVNIFELPASPWRVTWNARRGLGAWLARSGLVQPPRDIGVISRQLLEGGHVAALGGEDRPLTPYRRNDDEVLKRIAALTNP